MTEPTFLKLNEGWNAEPNAPDPKVEVYGSGLILRFHLNHMLYPDFAVGQIGAITFTDCSCWRLGPTSDEGWYSGQCRYSSIAPEWGKFHEIL